MKGRGQEILSHSSLKTNDRLDKWFTMLDYACIQVWTNPTEDNLNEYYACMTAIYNTLYSVVFNKKDEDSVCIDKFLWQFPTQILAINKPSEPIAKLEARFKLRDRLTYAHRYLYSALQRQEYFFKIGQRGARGFEEVMDNLKEQTDIFENGNKGV